MKKLLVIAILLMATSAMASPYLVCDSQQGVTHYKITGLPWITEDVFAQTDGSLKTDVALSPLGTNSITVSACIQDETWGEVCGQASPFSYIRPQPPAITNNIRLIQ
jgi:hypothetical protein